MGELKNTSREISYLTPEQVKQLETACQKPESALLVRLLFQTGARISEVLALKPCDIDKKNQRLTLPALKRKDISTKLVVIAPDTLSVLEKYCHGKSANKKLFNFSRQQAYYIIRMAAKKAGLGKIHPHTLRDSFAVNWALNGGSLNLLQRQLGHRSFITTVDRYLTFSSEDIRKEYNRVLTDK
jgi:integrase/recombinase XerD